MIIKKIIKISLIVITSIAFFFGLAIIIMSLFNGNNPLLPIYEETSQDGVSVVIEGVRYKLEPRTEWSVFYLRSEDIGYANNYFSSISTVKDDTNKNFVFISTLGASTVLGPLYRADIEIPVPSAETINKISFFEQIPSYIYESCYSYLYVTGDKEIIDELFYYLDDCEEKNDKPDTNATVEISLACESNSLLGAQYFLDCYINEGKIYCGTSERGYVEIPTALFEKLAGKDIDYLFKEKPEEYLKSKKEVLTYIDTVLGLQIEFEPDRWIVTNGRNVGEVCFCPLNVQLNRDLTTEFIISYKEKEDSTIEDFWNISKTYLAETYTGFRWEESGQIAVGDYIGYRFHYKSRKMEGDCIIWEAQGRLYKCVMTANKDEYDDVIAILFDTLKTFSLPNLKE